MATVRKETDLACSADAAWDALRDVGALHARRERIVRTVRRTQESTPVS